MNSCYYDASVTITTGGSMLVNGVHSITLPLLTGFTSVTYVLSHPSDGTREEWVNITVSGPCVDYGQYQPVTTQSRLQVIVPCMYFSALFHMPYDVQ
jgi:hypothetical protein